MKLSIPILITLATAATALPNLSTRTKTKHHCLTQERAEYIVSRERVYLLKADPADARAAGEELFSTDSFVQYSDSINSLRGDPVSSLVTFHFIPSYHIISCPIPASSFTPLP